MVGCSQGCSLGGHESFEKNSYHSKSQSNAMTLAGTCHPQTWLCTTLRDTLHQSPFMFDHPLKVRNEIAKEVACILLKTLCLTIGLDKAVSLDTLTFGWKELIYTKSRVKLT